jgi:apolipoprotein N-acyltransferase
MPKTAPPRFRRAGAAPPATVVPLVQRWYGKALLEFLSVLLLSLAFAPVKLFFLAWVGLVPWLVLVRNCRTPWRAFGWSWITGVGFFAANMWWLGRVTGPGVVALMPILGLYWAVAGFILRGTGLVNLPVDGTTGQPTPSDGVNAAAAPSSILRPLSSILPLLGIAAVWVTLEWLRGTWPFEGLPWLYLAHTQTPALHLCQVADTVGEMGVSFWVALVNAWVFLFLVGRMSFRRAGAGLAFVLVVTAGVIGYGFYRFAQWPAVTVPGPTVLVVQPNIPQDNSGEKGMKLGDLIDLHFELTRPALKAHPGVDLVVWSETMMPSLNRQTRDYLRGDGRYGDLVIQTHREIADLAYENKTAFLVGGAYFDKFQQPSNGEAPAPYHAHESRNSAYYFERGGAFSDQRYDKLHLVPFGEYIPFKETIPPLYKLLVSLGPPNMEDYQLARGDEKHLTSFHLPRGSPGSPAPAWRFVSPICFEDMDGPLVARMFRPTSSAAGAGTTGKRADFIVNLTNDGWFAGGENAQHFQAAQFRSIENRAPTARSVNTGISGFIDSMGRPYDFLPAHTEGTRAAQLRLDARTTPFSRFGNVFAFLCVGATSILAGAGLVRWVRRRRSERSNAL